MLSAFGANDVWVLNGGMAKWSAEGRPTTDQATEVTANDGSAWSLQDGFIYSLEEMHKVSASLT